MASDAVGLERVSKVVGYKITKGNFSDSTPNLPQRVVILGEANADNQLTLDTDKKEVISAQQAGILYGFGSPVYMALRILRPFSGSGIGGIPTIVYAQEEAAGATAKVFEITPVGVATANATHTLIVAGRRGIDGVSYDFTVNAGDTDEEIVAKMIDSVNNVLGSPITAGLADYNSVELTSKWKGLTADDLTVDVDTNSNSAGITYAVVETQSGAGTPSIASALADFGNDWNTIVINTYGTVESIMDALESVNGRPDPSNPTGRFEGIIMKPFFAFTGSIVDDPSSITDSRSEDVTIAICPAPNSAGLPLEAAANFAFLQATQAQNTPHLDISGQFLPDMPTPLSIGSMDDYNFRDSIVKKGCSTVELNSGRYRVCDFVTTYHPVGENPPQFRYVRNLVIDFNIRFKYYLLEQTFVVDHAIASNETVVNAARVIKPMQWIQILNKFSDDLSAAALIADPQFTKQSLIVNISTTNPDRFETFYRYKRTGFGRISSTTVEAGFNFGTIN